MTKGSTELSANGSPILNVQDDPRVPDVVRGHRAKFVGLLLAGQYRRSLARNRAVKYGTGLAANPGHLLGANTDLLFYYDLLIEAAETAEAADNLYEILFDKRLQAESLIEALRGGDITDIDVKAEMFEQLQDLETDIERLAGLMEDLDGA